MRRVIVLALASVLLGCASQDYWVRPATNLRMTAADLQACRQTALESANRGGERVFTARELESPCMAAKGYGLSKTPPPAD